MMPRNFTRLLLLCLPLVLFACDDDRARTRLGYELMQAGNFDGAFEIFQRASLAHPDDAELKAAMGILLSLRSISVPAAIELLEESLRETRDAKTRWQLLVLYLDLNRTARARKLLGPERVPLDDYFTPEMSLYRAGVECIADPGRGSLKVLEKKAEDNPAARYFLVRCHLSPGWPERERAEHTGAAAELIDKIEDPEHACGLLVAWPLAERIALENYDDRLRDCRRRFPGQIAIQRELGRTPGPAGEDPGDERTVREAASRGLRQIFTEDARLPPYPDIPHWKSVSGGINLETGKEYVRIQEPDPDSAVTPGEDEEDPDTRDYDEYFRDARP